MGVMRILDASGDTAVAWRNNDVESVREAELMFERLQAERKMAFGRTAAGGVDDFVQVRSFDTALEEIVWVRPVQGG